MGEVEAHVDATNNTSVEIGAMKTFPLAKESGHAFAFEIENAYVSRRMIAQLLRRAEGVTEVHLRGRFGSSDETRVDFKYLGYDYVVWEPFGDNSRYLIGPKEEGVETDVLGLEAIFKRYQPSPYRALLGDLLTLRLFRRLVGRR